MEISSVSIFNRHSFYRYSDIGGRWRGRGRKEILARFRLTKINPTENPKKNKREEYVVHFGGLYGLLPVRNVYRRSTYYIAAIVVHGYCPKTYETAENNRKL